MVTFYEMIPEIIPIFFVVFVIVIARCFTEPLADASEVIDKSEFKSLQQGLYNKTNTMQYEDEN
jgi:branched-subunit amino acid permease